MPGCSRARDPETLTTGDTAGDIHGPSADPGHGRRARAGTLSKGSARRLAMDKASRRGTDLVRACPNVALSAPPITDLTRAHSTSAPAYAGSLRRLPNAVNWLPRHAETPKIESSSQP